MLLCMCATDLIIAPFGKVWLRTAAPLDRCMKLECQLSPICTMED